MKESWIVYSSIEKYEMWINEQPRADITMLLANMMRLYILFRLIRRQNGGGVKN